MANFVALQILLPPLPGLEVAALMEVENHAEDAAAAADACCTPNDKRNNCNTIVQL